MPYPIDTLPYPFKKRLRQLLTPVELYQLQKATGHLEENHHLLPLMKRRKCFLLHSTTTPDNELVVQWFIKGPDKNYITDTSPYVYQPEYFAILEKFHESHLSSPKFQHVLFDGLKTIDFRDTVMTESLLSALAQKKIKVTEFKREKGRKEKYADGFHRLPALVAAFPTATMFEYPCFAYSGWLQDLLKLKKYDLEILVLSSNNFKKLFCFRSKEMLKFIKRQSKHNDKFILHMEYKVNDITIIELEQILSLFQPYFELCDNMIGCHLSMRIINVSKNLRNMFYFKLRPVSDYAFAHFVCTFHLKQRRFDCSGTI